MTNQANNKRENEIYITMDGVITQDAYDKTRYHWDPQLKKTVYTRVEKKKGKVENKPNTGGFDWQDEVRRMSENWKANLSEQEVQEQAQSLEEEFNEWKRTGVIEGNGNLMNTMKNLEEDAKNGDTHAKELLEKLESDPEKQVEQILARPTPTKENRNKMSMQEKYGKDNRTREERIQDITRDVKNKFIDGTIDYEKAVSIMQKTGLNRSDAQASVDAMEVEWNEQKKTPTTKDVEDTIRLANEYVQASPEYKGMNDKDVKAHYKYFSKDLTEAKKTKSLDPIMPYIQNLHNLANDNTKYEYNNKWATSEKKQQAQQQLDKLINYIGVKNPYQKIKSNAQREKRID